MDWWCHHLLCPACGTALLEGPVIEGDPPAQNADCPGCGAKLCRRRGGQWRLRAPSHRRAAPVEREMPEAL